ncbi:hypothetical protein IV203_033972 [Nitzschia inconspicua]|uniref:Uncharacterized protein n=1 Tax=Nitzschia inconspicua TaxID=303405 RepID=A0A9K3M3V4_9STRA|nr:hypothetical protein IV203_033972 [Nitzschia inconspicua]
MCSPPQDPLQPPSRTIWKPTVTLLQGYAMSDADITTEDQSQNRASQRLDLTKEPLHPPVNEAPGTKLSQPPLPPQQATQTPKHRSYTFSSDPLLHQMNFPPHVGGFIP